MGPKVGKKGIEIPWYFRSGIPIKIRYIQIDIIELYVVHFDDILLFLKLRANDNKSLYNPLTTPECMYTFNFEMFKYSAPF